MTCTKSLNQSWCTHRGDIPSVWGRERKKGEKKKKKKKKKDTSAQHLRNSVNPRKQFRIRLLPHIPCRCHRFRRGVHLPRPIEIMISISGSIFYRAWIADNPVSCSHLKKIKHKTKKIYIPQPRGRRRPCQRHGGRHDADLCDRQPACAFSHAERKVRTV
jgi:hypothetical protein